MQRLTLTISAAVIREMRPGMRQDGTCSPCHVVGSCLWIFFFWIRLGEDVSMRYAGVSLVCLSDILSRSAGEGVGGALWPSFPGVCLCAPGAPMWAGEAATSYFPIRLPLQYRRSR